jgi:predicted unusual protein kinase regulating ubiquinone biosynthesis (AarF/ABC1/UbiB family)
MLSTRPDLVGGAFAGELARLRDDVPPLPQGTVEAQLVTELGPDWRARFGSFEDVPLAAGTIAQVHRATLLDGSRVVAKVQRPDAEGLILADLALLQLFARHAGRRKGLTELLDVEAVFAHLDTSLRRELDFTQEAANLRRIAPSLAPYARLALPQVHDALSTARVLVMEEARGAPVEPAPTTRARRETAAQLVACYYRQILAEGVFHADPHPGNVLFDGERLWLLDFGMIGELGPAEREQALLLVLAFWRGDAAGLAEAMLLSAGDGARTVDPAAFERDLASFVAQHRGSTLAEVELGPVLEGLGGIAARHGVRLPAPLVLAGKALAQVQLTASALDPDLDPMAAVGSFVRSTIVRGIAERADPQAILYELYQLRARTRRLVESVERLTGARPGARLQVDVLSGARIERELRRLAYLLAVALIVAGALIALAIAVT